MKSIFITLFFVVLASACSLEEEPFSFLSSEEFFQSEEDAEAAIIAAYDILGIVPMYGYSLFLGELPGPEAFFPRGAPNHRQMDDLSVNSGNTFLFEFWSNTYEGINRANVVINRVPLIDMPQEKIETILAEARFIRALHYFNLVRLFGGVPLKTEETTELDNVNLARNSTQEVFQFVTDELEAISTSLPVTWDVSSTGRATKASAEALLAIVYLTQGSPYWNAGVEADPSEYDLAHLAKAKEYALNVISDSNYGLLDEFSSVFDLANENSQEHVFSIQHIREFDEGTWIPALTTVREDPLVFSAGGWGTVAATQPFYDSWPEDDLRKDGTVFTEYIDNEGEVKTTARPYIKKYQDPNGLGPGAHENNFPVIRYAEILLVLAEAENELNGPTPVAYEAINQLRSRAGLPSLQDTPGYSESQANLRNAILEERKWELIFEGQRYYDLVRTLRLDILDTSGGRNGDGIPGDVDDFRYLMPIPIEEISRNPALEQNPGY